MLSLNFTPFPNLETERLSLRRVIQNDADAILELRSKAETMKYIPKPLLKTTADAMEHIAMIDSKIEKHEGINWGITLKNNSKLIGIIGFYRIKPEHFRAEIGYMLLPAFKGKGFISEAVNRVLNYGFIEMNLHSIEGITDPDNLASAQVLLKNGFVKEAHLKENEFYQGRFLDTVIYSKVNNL
jgi:ribosomal-protein-alanine N-acetyltransferase